MKAVIRSVGTCVFVLALASSAQAQATRTWVSGVGDDANPCSRTAPCKTFAGAISKTAANGIISVLDPGGYGAVTITKSITLDGGGIEGSILASGGVNGININAVGIDVTVRNLTIYGSDSGLYGIRITNASKVTIENVIIQGFTDGINISASADVAIKNTLIGDNSGFGVYVRNARTTLENVQLVDNAVDGLRIGTAATGTIRNSIVTGSLNLGLSAAEAATAKLTVDSCVVDANAWGVGAAGGATVWVSNTTVSNSSTQGLYFAAASSLLTFGNNRLTNNLANGTFSGSASVQ